MYSLFLFPRENDFTAFHGTVRSSFASRFYIDDFILL